MADSGSRPTIKFLRARLLLDDVRSLTRGWYFRTAPVRKADRPADGEQYTLSEIAIPIRWKEGLKEVNYSRIHNMGLGCQLVNGTILRPGEVFSLRRFLGPASETQGFRKGPMFVRGRLTYVPGGGACLVSTLLFNVALMANLPILEKHNHSTDFWGEDRFIGLGLDATYVYGRKDLKFRNAHGADIRILAELTEGTERWLRCRLVSSKPLVEPVTIETEVLQELRPKADRESSGATAEEKPYRKGWVVRTTRSVAKADGQAVNYAKLETYKPYFLS